MTAFTNQPPVSLRGRSSECALLDDLLSAVRRGEGRSLVLLGEAGIGKTALLDYLVESASDVAVARAVGVESEMELAYASLHQLCGPMLDRMTRLPAPQREALEVVFGFSAGAAPDRFLVGLAVLSLLSEAAEERPLLCVVDDAQWLDRASALTLGFVGRRLLAESLGLVFAAREPSEALRHVSEIRVQGLREGDARALLNSALRLGLDERVRDQIIVETRGNPLALLELPRGLTASQLAGGFGLVGAQALPGRIEESFVRRLNALSESGRRLLLLAAAEPTGDPVLLWRAAEQLGIGRTAADDLDEAGLLAIGDRVTFRHPLVRSAVYGSAAPSERRAVHLALGEATDGDADPDRRAWHLAAAASGPDEHAALELERSAGRAQARGGLSAAAAFLQRAVELTSDPGRRVDRALAAAEANLQAGEFDVARSLVTSGEAGPLDEFQRARVELLRGQIALFSAPGPDAVELLLGAARRLGQVDISLARDTYLDAWGAALYAGREGALLEVSRAAMSTPCPDGGSRPSDLLLDSLATLVADGRAAAAKLLEKATQTFVEEQVPGPGSLRWGWLTVVPSYVLWDEVATRSLCERQIRAIRGAGALGRLMFDLQIFNLIALRCGDLAGAAAAIAERDAIVQATGTIVGPTSAMLLASFRGRETEARALISSVRQESIRLGQGIDHQLTQWMLALLCNGLGLYEESVAAALEASNDNPEEIFVSAWATLELLEAAVKSDQPKVAHTALARILAATAVARTDSARGIEARSRAQVSDGATAEGLYQEAIKRLGHSRLRPELARAHLLYGEWLRREGRRVDAREQLRTAYDQLTSIGMEAFAERAGRELLATGATARKRVDETRDELTSQEALIARLASDGLSNPEIGTRLFISPRTVKYHLRKVFTKLDITTRHELAAVLPSEHTGQPH